jgi:uncharacterized protein YbjQ (UPF0145 family)
MILTNTETVPGREIAEILGVVRGNTVRAKHIGKDFLAGLKGIIGGEVGAYTELLSDAREQAMARMVEAARQAGADAVVNIRFMTSSVAQGMAELLAYGTAVKFR